jgi:hypothetical protein
LVLLQIRGSSIAAAGARGSKLAAAQADLTAADLRDIAAAANLDAHEARGTRREQYA